MPNRETLSSLAAFSRLIVERYLVLKYLQACYDLPSHTK